MSKKKAAHQPAMTKKAPAKAKKAAKRAPAPARRRGTRTTGVGAEIGGVVVPELAGRAVEAITEKPLGKAASKGLGHVTRSSMEGVGRKIGEHAEQLVVVHGPTVRDAAAAAASSAGDAVSNAYYSTKKWLGLR